MSSFQDLNEKLEKVDIPESHREEEKPSTSSTMSGDRPKRAGRKPGRRSSKMDVRAKLERSRQSARECRARKKMRYQYLEDLVANREKAVFALRNELEMYKQWCMQVDKGLLPLMLLSVCQEETKKEAESRKKETCVPISAFIKTGSPREPAAKSNGTCLDDQEKGAKDCEITECKEKRKMDHMGGASGGPEDHLMSQSTLNLDDIMSLLSAGESTDDDDDDDDDDDEEEYRGQYKGGYFRGGNKKDSKGEILYDRLLSIRRNDSKGDNYSNDKDIDIEIDQGSTLTTKLPTIVEEI